MSAKFIKTEHVEKSSYKDFKLKATDFYYGIKVAQQASLWHTMGVAAVHATISIGDALTTNYLGVRSIADDHRLAKEILLKIQIKDIEQYCNFYGRIVAKKNAITYERRSFTQKEALEIAKQAQRFYDWAIKQIP
jgi:DNA-binding Lrp family transcriptional regulator